MSMPSTYDSSGTATTPALDAFDRSYVLGVDGILKAVQGLLALITFICATAYDPFVIYFGGGWVQFVGITAFLINVILYIMYFFYVMEKLPVTVPMTLIEFIYYAIFTFFFFTAGIVAGVKGNINDAVGAAAFFAFASCAAFAVDVYFKFMKWRASYPRPSTGGVTTTTTSSAAGAEAGAQY